MNVNNNPRYRQPAPKSVKEVRDRVVQQNNIPNRRRDSGESGVINNKKPPNNHQNQNVKQSFWLEILQLISQGANALGEFMISDKFVGTIQKIFQQHLDLLNYVLMNYSSEKFWFNNLIYSLILTGVFFLKGFLYRTTITFEIFLVMSIISFIVLKIQKSKGDVIEVTVDMKDYITSNAKKKERSEEHPTVLEEPYMQNQGLEFDEEDDEVEGEPVYYSEPEQRKSSKLEFLDENEVNEEEKEDVLQKIRQMSKQCREQHDRQPSVEAFNRALKHNENARKKLNYNNIMTNIQQRNMVDQAMESLKDIGKPRELDSKYAGLTQ